jgi:hypothetical protein
MKSFLALASLVVLMGLSSASAQSIDFTESAVASGSFGGYSFSDVVITLSAIANEGNFVTLPPEIPSGTTALTDSSVSINIQGFGNATFTDSIETFVFTGGPAAGLTDVQGGILSSPPPPGDILDVSNEAFSTYGLASSIGPVLGAAITSEGSFSTTAGSLKITSVSGDATFQAIEAPECPTVSFLLGGLLSLAMILKPAQGPVSKSSARSM